MTDLLKSRPWAARVFLLVLVAAVYARTIGYPFAFDDFHSIESNPSLVGWRNFFKVWTSARFYSGLPEHWSFRPFTTWLQLICWNLGGGASWPFRVAKILLHAGLCATILAIWTRLLALPVFETLRAREGATGWLPLLIAAAFAVHPANTELVEYISASSTLLCGLCYSLAYLFYLKGRAAPSGMALRPGLASLAFFCLSVLAKEEGISFIGVIALSEWLLFAGLKRPGRYLGALLALELGAAALLQAMYEPSNGYVRSLVGWWPYFMTQWRAYLHYIALMFWPWELNADNVEFGFSTAWTQPPVLAALLGNFLLIFAAWRLRKREPIWLFSLAWFYVAISPASSVVSLAEPVNEHRMTIAYVGLFGAGAVALVRLCAFVRAPRFAVPALLSLLAIGAVARSSVYASSEALWTDTHLKNPTSVRAMNNLALIHMGRAEWARALELLADCERLAPTYMNCKLNTAITLAAAGGRDPEAEKKFQEALALDPRRSGERIFYGEFLLRRKRWLEALAVFEGVEQLSPGVFVKSQTHRIEALLELGRKDEARRGLAQAIERFGESPELAALRSRL